MRPDFDTCDPDLMPDGTHFARWQDDTDYRRIYHVDCEHSDASDAHDGSVTSPWRTIGRAAAALQPGEKVIVHRGIYREYVRPARGGTGPDAMIRYEAAAGEEVVIRASEVWRPHFAPGSSWRLFRTASAGCAIWIGELPGAWFLGEHPFLACNLSRSGCFPWLRRPMEEVKRAQLRCGMVFQDGRRLTQAYGPQRLLTEPGRFWVEERGRFLALRLFDDADPTACTLEVSTRSQCFAAEEPLGWIAVAGFTLEHAANVVPVPQYGALSAGAGHHWILEGNTVREANAVGIDIGCQADVRSLVDVDAAGCHIVRGNTVSDCGITGLCGSGGVSASLIEGNRFARIGRLDLEHCYEAAAIKFHYLRGALIRDNTICDCDHACGIWLDFLCEGNRVSSNGIVGVRSVLAGIYLEASPATVANVIDRNLVWDCQDNPPNDPPKDGIAGGLGISLDICEEAWILDNLVGQCQNHAIACHLAQRNRRMRGRSVLCRGMHIHGNVVVGCQNRIYLARTQDTTCDGNHYDATVSQAACGIQEPDRIAWYDLQTWRRAGYDHAASEFHGCIRFAADEPFAPEAWLALGDDAELVVGLHRKQGG